MSDQERGSLQLWDSAHCRAPSARRIYAFRQAAGMNPVKDGTAVRIPPIANAANLRTNRALVLEAGPWCSRGDANALIPRVGHKGSISRRGFLKHEAKEEHP